MARSELFGESKQLGHAGRPADKDNVVELEMFDEFLYVLCAALARVALRGLVGVALRSWVEGNHVKMLGKILDLRVPNPGGHAPTRFEKHGGTAASFEIMKLYAVAGFE